MFRPLIKWLLLSSLLLPVIGLSLDFDTIDKIPKNNQSASAEDRSSREKSSRMDNKFWQMDYEERREQEESLRKYNQKMSSSSVVGNNFGQCYNIKNSVIQNICLNGRNSTTCDFKDFHLKNFCVSGPSYDNCKAFRGDQVIKRICDDGGGDACRKLPNYDSQTACSRATDITTWLLFYVYGNSVINTY